MILCPPLNTPRSLAGLRWAWTDRQFMMSKLHQGHVSKMSLTPGDPQKLGLASTLRPVSFPLQYTMPLQVPMASQIHLSFPYAGPSKRRSTAGPRRSVACVPVAQTKVQTPPWRFLCFLGGFSELQCGLRHMLGFVAVRVC